MKYTENHYKVVNRAWNQSLPETFATMQDALDAQKAWDEYAHIECHNGGSVEVVYNPSWGGYVTKNPFV